MSEANKGGRPTFEPTDDMRLTVEHGASCGVPVREIAAGIGCDEKTLRKHFDQELLNGRSRRRLHMLNLLFKSAEDGNVSAQKHLEQLIAMSGEIGGARPTQQPFAPKEEKPGTKEMRAAHAQEAPPEGSKWAGLLN